MFDLMDKNEDLTIDIHNKYVYSQDDLLIDIMRHETFLFPIHLN